MNHNELTIKTIGSITDFELPLINAVAEAAMFSYGDQPGLELIIKMDRNVVSADLRNMSLAKQYPGIVPANGIYASFTMYKDPKPLAPLPPRIIRRGRPSKKAFIVERDGLNIEEIYVIGDNSHPPVYTVDEESCIELTQRMVEGISDSRLDIKHYRFDSENRHNDQGRYAFTYLSVKTHIKAPEKVKKITARGRKVGETEKLKDEHERRRQEVEMRAGLTYRVREHLILYHELLKQQGAER